MKKAKLLLGSSKTFILEQDSGDKQRKSLICLFFLIPDILSHWHGITRTHDEGLLTMGPDSGAVQLPPWLKIKKSDPFSFISNETDTCELVRVFSMMQQPEKRHDSSAVPSQS